MDSIFISRKNKTNFLSNSSCHKFYLDGHQWISVDHYILYNRYINSGDYSDIIKNAKNRYELYHITSPKNIITFSEDYNYGYNKPLLIETNDWYKIKYDVIQRAIKAKFDQNPIIKDELCNTGNFRIVGKNKMTGEILEKLRKKYKNVDNCSSDQIINNDIENGDLNKMEILLIKLLIRVAKYIAIFEKWDIVFPEMVEDAIRILVKKKCVYDQISYQYSILKELNLNQIYDKLPNFYSKIISIDNIISTYPYLFDEKKIVIIIGNLFRWLELFSSSKYNKFIRKRIDDIRSPISNSTFSISKSFHGLRDYREVPAPYKRPKYDKLTSKYKHMIKEQIKTKKCPLTIYKKFIYNNLVDIQPLILMNYIRKKMKLPLLDTYNPNSKSTNNLDIEYNINLDNKNDSIFNLDNTYKFETKTDNNRIVKDLTPEKLNKQPYYDKKININEKINIGKNSDIQDHDDHTLNKDDNDNTEHTTNNRNGKDHKDDDHNDGDKDDNKEDDKEEDDKDGDNKEDDKDDDKDDKNDDKEDDDKDDKKKYKSKEVAHQPQYQINYPINQSYQQPFQQSINTPFQPFINTQFQPYQQPIVNQHMVPQYQVTQQPIITPIIGQQYRSVKQKTTAKRKKKKGKDKNNGTKNEKSNEKIEELKKIFDE